MGNSDFDTGTGLDAAVRGFGHARQSTRLQEPANRAEVAARLIADMAAMAEPDEKLGSKEDLRERCAVSVGTFNEALKLTQMRGVVTLRRGPGGGIFAAKQTPLARLGNKFLEMEGSENLIADIQRMRAALDPLIIEDALMHSSAADIAELRGYVAQMRQSMADQDAASFIRQNWQFQIRTAHISPNNMLRSVSLSLLEILAQHAVDLPLPASEAEKEILRRRFRHYEDMANALEARDREAAMLALQRHNAEVQPTARS
jgi:DNA-binding FadR family transcriptional regulator